MRAGCVLCEVRTESLSAVNLRLNYGEYIGLSQINLFVIVYKNNGLHIPKFDLLK
jgi:hypothetical protein